MKHDTKCSLCETDKGTVLCNDMNYYCPSCLEGMQKTNKFITPVKIEYNDKRNFTGHISRMCGNDPSD